MKEKDRFRKAPSNYAMKKTSLLKDKVLGSSETLSPLFIFAAVSHTNKQEDKKVR